MLLNLSKKIASQDHSTDAMRRAILKAGPESDKYWVLVIALGLRVAGTSPTHSSNEKSK
jgi:hypothetical protein